MHKNPSFGLGTAPLGTALTVLSLGIIVLAGALTVIDGRVPSFAPLAVIGALVLAVAGAVEASRPARRERADRHHGVGRSG